MLCLLFIIIFRNLVEKNHKTLVEHRRAHFSESDRVALAQFKRAKEGEWQKERQQTRPQLRPAVWIAILLIAILFCGLVSIVAVSGIESHTDRSHNYTMVILLQAVLFSLVAFSGSNNELVRKPVVQWDNTDVMDWLGGLGDWASDKNISRVFLKEVL